MRLSMDTRWPPNDGQAIHHFRSPNYVLVQPSPPITRFKWLLTAEQKRNELNVLIYLLRLASFFQLFRMRALKSYMQFKFVHTMRLASTSRWAAQLSKFVCVRTFFDVNMSVGRYPIPCAPDPLCRGGKSCSWPYHSSFSYVIHPFDSDVDIDKQIFLEEERHIWSASIGSCQSWCAVAYKRTESACQYLHGLLQQWTKTHTHTHIDVCLMRDARGYMEWRAIESPWFFLFLPPVSGTG